MTTSELIAQLQRLPSNTEVWLRIKTENGFYDVRSSFATSKLTDIEYWESTRRVDLEGL